MGQSRGWMGMTHVHGPEASAAAATAVHAALSGSSGTSMAQSADGRVRWRLGCGDSGDCVTSESSVRTFHPQQHLQRGKRGEVGTAAVRSAPSARTKYKEKGGRAEQSRTYMLIEYSAHVGAAGTKRSEEESRGQTARRRADSMAAAAVTRRLLGEPLQRSWPGSAPLAA
jgi:hypothetical protein